jgi:hypothetical protein
MRDGNVTGNNQQGVVTHGFGAADLVAIDDGCSVMR